MDLPYQNYQSHNLTRQFRLHSPGRRRKRMILEYIGVDERTGTPRPPLDNHAELFRSEKEQIVRIFD